MEVIDGAWIRARLTGVRGEKARLAACMGIRAEQLSKVLADKRDVQPEEVPSVLAFFDAAPAEPSSSPELLALLADVSRLNSVGQDLLRKQLAALLETPELVQSPESNDEAQ